MNAEKAAKTLLDEFVLLGFTLEPSPEGLLYHAPKECVTSETIAKLRKNKSILLCCLNRRCPFCKANGMRQTRHLQDGLIYVDTRCLACGGIVETYVPAEQPFLLVESTEA